MVIATLKRHAHCEIVCPFCDMVHDYEMLEERGKCSCGAIVETADYCPVCGDTTIFRKEVG